MTHSFLSGLSTRIYFDYFLIFLQNCSSLVFCFVCLMGKTTTEIKWSNNKAGEACGGTALIQVVAAPLWLIDCRPDDSTLLGFRSDIGERSDRYQPTWPQSRKRPILGIKMVTDGELQSQIHLKFGALSGKIH